MNFALFTIRYSTECKGCQIYYEKLVYLVYFKLRIFLTAILFWCPSVIFTLMLNLSVQLLDSSKIMVMNYSSISIIIIFFWVNILQNVYWLYHFPLQDIPNGIEIHWANIQSQVLQFPVNFEFCFHYQTYWYNSSSIIYIIKWICHFIFSTQYTKPKDQYFVYLLSTVSEFKTDKAIEETDLT